MKFKNKLLIALAILIISPVIYATGDIFYNYFYVTSSKTVLNAPPNRYISIGTGTGCDSLSADNKDLCIEGNLQVKGVTYGDIDLPVTKTYYVDKGRTDSYTETGSQLTPFKTISAAINEIISLDSSEYIGIQVESGIYDENIILENSALRYLVIEGHGYVSINPSVGNALQSTANNDNLIALRINNVTFAKSVILTGSNGASSFSDVMLSNVNFTGGNLEATCLNNFSMKDVYSERPIVYHNVVWSYIESGQLQGTFTARMDSTTDYPSGGSDGTVLANGVFQSGTVAYIIGGTATYTVAPNGSRWGSGAVTIPAGVSILAYNSFLRGTLTNNGSITLRNSTMDGYIAGTGTLNLDDQPASQFKNDSSIAGTTIKDALNNLSGAVITFSGITSLTYDGNQGGYSGANALCNAEYTGSHVCNDKEIAYLRDSGTAFGVTGNYWFNANHTGYPLVLSNDCNGWTTTTGAYGNYWDFTQMIPLMAACDVSGAFKMAFACCK